MLLISGTETEGCQNDYDCSNIANSQCVNRECICKDNYREEDDRCLPSNPFVVLSTVNRKAYMNVLF